MRGGWRKRFCIGGSQNVVLGPAASASSGNVLEMQLLRSNPRTAEARSLGPGPSHLCFHKLSGGFDSSTRSSLRTLELQKGSLASAGRPERGGEVPRMT